MQTGGSDQLTTDVIKKDLCIGCGACIGLCPYFQSYKGKTAPLFSCTLSQGRCFAYCPKVEVDLDSVSRTIFGEPYDGHPLGRFRSVKISRAGDAAPAGKFQSGGTVSALMHFALKKGIVDAAVLTGREGLLPVPCRVTNPDDVLSFSGSRYTAAPTLEAVNRAVKDGFTRIGLVGTPCQTLAAAQMRSNPMKVENFVDPIGLVIGLFCTWSLDFRRFESFISKVTDIQKITKIDIPPPPANVMEIFTEDEKIEISLDEIRTLVGNSCSYCPDMTSEFSDISVGVLENQPDFNTLVIRTARGEKLVEEAVREGYLTVGNMPSESLDHLRWAAANKKKRAVVKAEAEGRINTAQGCGSAMFRISAKTIREITG